MSSINLSTTARSTPKPPQMPQANEAIGVHLVSAWITTLNFNLESQREELLEYTNHASESINNWYSAYLQYFNELSSDSAQFEEVEAVKEAISSKQKVEWDIGDLFPLASRNADDTRFLYGPSPLWVHTEKPDGTVLPSTRGKIHSGSSMKFKMMGGQQCPRFELQLIVEKNGLKTPKPHHEAILIFSLGKTDLEQYDQITDLNVKLGENMELGEDGDIISQ
ncbi:MAG: hypothetical protein Q9225_007453 [Loekoesia sp. 1 TL-2023]